MTPLRPVLSRPEDAAPPQPGPQSESAPGSLAAGRLQACLAMRATNALSGALALSLIAFACALTLWLGIPRASVYGHDVFILLDGGWRVLNGQRPHADFYSALGPLPYLIAAAGLKLAALRVEGLDYATSAVGAVVGLWAWALLRRRLKAWSALLALAFVVLFWLAPFPFGEPFYLTGYAMQYNRLGYVLASLVLLELYAPREGPVRNMRLDAGGLSTGIAAGLLCFLKINFFLVTCALIASAYLLSRKGRAHFLAVLAGFALVAVPMLAYLHGNLAAMLHDLTIVAAARRIRFSQGYDPFRTVFRNLGTILAVAGLAFLAWMHSHETHGQERKTGPGLRGTLGLAAAAIAADFLLAMSNTQRQGFPLSLVAVLILADRLCQASLRPWRRTSRDAATAPAALAMVAAVLLMPELTDTVNGWGMIVRSHLQSVPDRAVARFDAPPIAGLILEDHDEPGVDPAAHNGALYVQRVNEGLDLLRRASSPGERIACLWFANPFSFALLRPPAHGGSTFFASGVNISAGHAPSAARILGNADVVIHPKTGRDDPEDDPELEALLAIVGPDLTRDYTIAAASPQWVVWRRR